MKEVRKDFLERITSKLTLILELGEEIREGYRWGSSQKSSTHNHSVWRGIVRTHGSWEKLEVK